MPKTPKTAPASFPKARIIIPAVLVAAALTIAATTSNIGDRIRGISQPKKSDTPTLVEKGDQDSTPAPPNTGPDPDPDPPKKFNPETYSPPAEGEIVDSHLVPGSSQTVILLSDLHAIAGTDADHAQEGIQVQIELFRILQDLVNSYGQIRLVQENHPQGVTIQQLASVAGDDEYNSKLIAELLSIKNPTKRIKRSEEELGHSFLPASAQFTATYPDQVDYIGPVTWEGSAHSMQLINSLADLEYTVNHRGEITPCEDLVGPLTYEEIWTKFHNGDRSAPMVDCYCDGYAYGAQLVEAFEEDRFVKAPSLEVSAALASTPSNGFSVIISGPNHLAETRRLLTEKGISYLIVSPRSITDETQEKLDKPEPFQTEGITPPDDANGTCAAWTEQAQQAYQEAIKAAQQAQQDAYEEWFNEE